VAACRPNLSTASAAFAQDFGPPAGGGSEPTFGAEFQINDPTGSGPSGGNAGIARDAAGNFLVVWSGSDGAANGVFARRFDNTGMPRGDEFQVNTYTTGNQFSPTAAMNDAGDFVVVWTWTSKVAARRPTSSPRRGSVAWKLTWRRWDGARLRFAPRLATPFKLDGKASGIMSLLGS
jgi:hypothetical protein